MIPGGASVNSWSFSCTACGAWSVAIASIVPSTSPARQASTSDVPRSGGATLVWVSKPSVASSVSVRWCGVTSAVTVTPRSRARRVPAAGAPGGDGGGGRGGGDGGEGQVRAGELGEQDVALDHHGLGDRGVARQAEPRRAGPLVHDAFADEAAVLAVRDHRRADEPRVGEHAPHHGCVLD